MLTIMIAVILQWLATAPCFLNFVAVINPYSFLKQVRVWFLKIDPVRIVGIRVRVCICVCVCVRAQGY